MASYRSESCLDKLKGGISDATPATSKEKRNFAVAAVSACVLLLIAGYVIFGVIGSNDAGTASASRVLIDSVTGEVFEKYRLPEGESFPYENKSTGKRTLYPAEPCFWTKDGKAKLQPTYVLLNEYAGKEGKTICPDCGHPVKAHNPLPPSNLFPQK